MAMATAMAGAKVCYVRCPKCLKVLPERADIPMYRCGGCGAVLRAKYRNSGKQDVGSAPETQYPSRSDSVNSSDAANCRFEKGESSNAGASLTNCGDEEEKSPKLEERISDGSSLHGEPNAMKSIETEERLDVAHNNLISSTASSSDAEAFSHSAAASEEEALNRPHRVLHNKHLRPSTASSSDDGSQASAREKYRQMSRRTYRDQRFSSSVGAGSNQGEGLSRSSTTNDAFYSVSSWVEPEDGSSCSGDSPANLKKLELLKLVEELRDQLTEKKQRSRFGSTQDAFLRDYPVSYQCPRLYQPLQMPPSYLHCHLEPNLCCNNALCTACSYDFCCRSSKPRCSVQHENPSYPYSRPKARTRKSYCRPVSGGAPFVACNKCFEVLRMPADFLVSTKTRLNKLRCGACSGIMVLSFPARDHEASQACSEAGKRPEDPVSFSEDYGVSFADSSSMEDEPVLNVSRVSSQASDSEKASLHRLVGYPSARELLF